MRQSANEFELLGKCLGLRAHSILSDKHCCKRMRIVALRSLAFRKIVCNYPHFLLFLFMSDISCGTVVNLLMTRANSMMDIW
jgi:hypothetical protein